jgi:hypothetical protein
MSSRCVVEMLQDCQICLIKFQVFQMKKLLKDWVIPPRVHELASKLRGAEPPTAKNLTSKALLDFKNVHKGERCFIIATGPSIKTQDLTPLTNEVCFGVSFFHLHEAYSKIQPKYHVLAPNHAPFDFELIKRYTDSLNERCEQPMDIFWGVNGYEFSAQNYFQQHQLNPNLRLHPIDYSSAARMDEYNYSNEDIWSYRSGPFTMRTVVYGAIQLAAYMGFSEIYLVGCDHNYLQELDKGGAHFYNEKDGNEKDAQHLEAISTEKWFFEYYSRWRDYRLMSTYLEGSGTQIYNATNGGMLDVFPRKSLNEIFES